MLVVPLQLPEQRFGAVLFRHHNWVPLLNTETLDFATKLGASISMALGNQRLYQEEHSVAETLQHALLQVPESVPGVKHSELYVSATTGTFVGGDFYDLFELPDGRVGLAIGDVSGKGLNAASLTATIRNTLRAAALDRLRPSAVVSKVNGVLAYFTPSEMFATLFFGILNPWSGVLHYVCGGHPPPLLKRTDGRIIRLSTGGTLVGAFSGAEFRQRSVRMFPGDLVFMYTDGMLEARTDGEMYGEDHVISTLSVVPSDADPKAVNRAMFDDVNRFARGRLADDLAMMSFCLKAGQRPPDEQVPE